MTMLLAEIDEYFKSLPKHLRWQLNRTERVEAHIRDAIANGWTVEQLVAESTRDLRGYYSPGGLITDRLGKCAEHEPPANGTAPKRPLCGDCDNGLIYHTPDDPKQPVTATKCPCRSAP